MCWRTLKSCNKQTLYWIQYLNFSSWSSSYLFTFLRNENPSRLTICELIFSIQYSEFRQSVEQCIMVAKYQLDFSTRLIVFNVLTCYCCILYSSKLDTVSTLHWMTSSFRTVCHGILTTCLNLDMFRPRTCSISSVFYVLWLNCFKNVSSLIVHLQLMSP